MLVKFQCAIHVKFQSRAQDVEISRSEKGEISIGLRQSLSRVISPRAARATHATATADKVLSTHRSIVPYRFALFTQSKARALRLTRRRHGIISDHPHPPEISMASYASNVVHCKLSNLVGSQPELILGVTLFDQLSKLYPGWRCWVYSEFEFQTFVAEQQAAENIFVIVPQLNLRDVGRVDYAVFVPQVSTQEPLLVIEIDGHDYHRTPDQVSNDNRRERTLTRRAIPFLRYTATDVLRNSDDHAQEIAQIAHIKLSEKVERENERAQLEDTETRLYYHRCGIHCV
jgi:hypothetical protein